MTRPAAPPREPGLYGARPPPLAPYAEALLAYRSGVRGAELRLRSSLGDDDAVPVGFFFRDEARMPDYERYALDLCRGRVLDLGAGAGPHTLALQAGGHPVVALEASSALVGLLERRGAASVVWADFRYWRRPGFDTVLMLMNGLGPIGTLAGLDRFLRHARRLLAPGGQLLIDGAAAERREAEPGGSMSREAATTDPGPAPSWPPSGAYAGEAWIELSYAGRAGRPFRELYVDPGTLARRARAAGWRCGLAFEAGDGAWLARLTARG